MPTVEEIAAEMGIDLATAKPEGVAKFRTYVADADKKYADAKTLATQAERNLAAVQQEQDEINTYIAQYGTSEEARAATEANLAAYKAVVDNLKEKGIAVDVPQLKTVAAAGGGNAGGGKPTFDPDKFRGAVSTTIGDLTDLNNKHIALTGQPLPDRSQALADEARKAGKSLYDYGAEKYDFAGKEKAKADAATAEQEAKWKKAGADEYAAKHPNVAGDPNQARGVESGYPQLTKPREAGDLTKFANMNPRQKIAASVARTREAIAAAQS